MISGAAKHLVAIGIPVVFFYVFSVYSMLEPYAPAPIVMNIQIGLFLILVIGYLYFGFFLKWPRINKTGWQMLAETIPTKKRKAIKFITIVALIPIFFGAIVWILERWFAYPTKILAQENVVIRLDCIAKNVWGRSSRGYVMIEGVRDDNGENMRFPWPAKTTPDCPGPVTVTGKEWILGVYARSVSGENVGQREILSNIP